MAGVLARAVLNLNQQFPELFAIPIDLNPLYAGSS
jgi:hypothetical protein